MLRKREYSQSAAVSIVSREVLCEMVKGSGMPDCGAAYAVKVADFARKK
jgi:hypothetical protein